MTSDDIANLLPALFRSTLQPDNPLRALLQLMESLQQPSEDVLAGLGGYFNPRCTPDAFVPYLAGLVDLDRFLPRQTDASSTVAIPQLREWVAAAIQMGRLRGTADGLRILMEAATGVTGYQILHQSSDLESEPAFHLRVRAPLRAQVHQVLLERIIDREKPAYMTFDRVEFDANL